jgi:RNA-binding protein YhbY
MIVTRFQIGKNGVTDGVIESLSLALKHHKQIRISTLKASGRNRENIEQMAKELIARLAEKKENCDYKIIGFTIILIKQSASKQKSKK